MAATPRGKNLLKITGIVLGCLLILLFGFHLWFRAHARHLLEDLVAKRSNGKVNMKLQKLHFGYFSNKMELENAVFFNTDSVDNNTAYRFSVKRIRLEVKALWPVLFKSEFLIDSLSLFEPDIQVTRLRVGKKDSIRNKEVSIPAEMGKVYNSIRDALKVLKVSSFRISEGKFTLINRIAPDELPITISNLNLHIDNFHVDTAITDPTKKILFSDNIILGSHHQDILFPDGRHRLSFRNFHINLREKIVRFDSCTIAATRTDSANASFNVYLDTLLLTNIDFDTLYRADLIKADSVYCVNPKFTLEVELGKRKGGDKNPPRLEDIVKQLTGNLELAHVVVSNAEFNIRTMRDSIPNSFVFTQNNFEMEGLHIKQEAAKPVQVKKFVMAIRNYENFIKDSTYSILFDSILLSDDRVTLSNFVFNKLQAGRITNSLRIPQFNLQGLSWDDLVFEKRLKADQAIMFNPVINYSIADPKRKENIFQVLGAVNDFMDLQYLDVIDGKIDLRVNDALRIQLDSATLAIQSHSLLTSTRLASIKNSLTRLYFKRGRIRAGNLDISLNDIRYIGNTGQLEAGTMVITDDEKDIDINLSRTSVDRMRVDELSGNIYANGLTWQSGAVKLSTSGKPSAKPVSLELHNVRGSNTSLTAHFGAQEVTTIIDNLYFSDLLKLQGKELQLTGLSVSGKSLSISDDERKTKISRYQLADENTSVFHDVTYHLASSGTEADLRSPKVVLIPILTSLLKGHLRFNDVELLRPEVSITQLLANPGVPSLTYPLLDVNKARLLQPVINYSQVRDTGTFSINWDGSKDGRCFLEFEGIHADSGKHLSVAVKKLGFYLSGFSTKGLRGKRFYTGKGSVSAQLSNVDFSMEPGLPAEWRATVRELQANTLELDQVGKRNGKLEMAFAGIQNLNISTTKVINLRRLITDNKAFLLSRFTGRYTDSVNSFAWHNAGFSRHDNLFSLDSVLYSPTAAKDDFMAKQRYQADYFTARAGRITIGPMDTDMYAESEIVKVKKATIEGAVMTDYRDKNLPLREMVSRPLPGTMVKRIPFPLIVDTLQLNGAHITYTEVNPDLGTTAIVPIHDLNATILSLKNTGYQRGDSLHIIAEGKLLDTLGIRLNVKESYLDSMQGFHMTVNMHQLNLRALNPVLESTSLVSIRSGYLDSLKLRVTGREELAYGKVDFHYHGLRIQILKNETEKKRRTGFLNFLVNSFVIRNKNKKTGDVFYIRNRERSAVNYLVRILMSGIMNSVGAKNYKKAMKPYEKEITNAVLPKE